ncbi:MAG TPA: outer membrane beta-barrel protein [Gemmatimonadaceae bacterium]|jgi:hypothetical protein|nr:outer membrane beta-barrel protein [Gemmatimonadaceae bacterium]
MQLARSMALALAVGLAAPLGAHAQARPIEIGLDAALAYDDADGASVTSLTIPVGRLRVGFFVSDAVSLEPFFALQYTRAEVDVPVVGDRTTSFTQYDLGLGLLFHFATDRTRSQPYLRPFVGVRGFSSDSDDDANDDDDSGTQPVLGAAFGLKLPSTSRLGTRLEAGFAHRFEDEPSFRESNQIFLSFGLSFFTR